MESLCMVNGGSVVSIKVKIGLAQGEHLSAGVFNRAMARPSFLSFERSVENHSLCCGVMSERYNCLLTFS
jgi:hypothetical protein